MRRPGLGEKEVTGVIVLYREIMEDYRKFKGKYSDNDFDDSAHVKTKKSKKNKKDNLSKQGFFDPIFKKLALQKREFYEDKIHIPRLEFVFLIVHLKLDVI